MQINQALPLNGKQVDNVTNEPTDTNRSQGKSPSDNQYKTVSVEQKISGMSDSPKNNFAVRIMGKDSANSNGGSADVAVAIDTSKTSSDDPEHTGGSGDFEGDTVSGTAPSSDTNDTGEAPVKTTSVSLVQSPPNPDAVVDVTINLDLNAVDQNALPSTKAFTDVILDADSYPMDAKYNFIKVAKNCEFIEKVGDYYMVYQRTAAPGPTGECRHYVIALKVIEQTSDRVRIEWYSLPESDAKAKYSYKLATDPGAIYTPYNHGYWEYDKANKSLVYSLSVDSGGSLPAWLVRATEGALKAFPKRLLDVKWGIKA